DRLGGTPVHTAGQMPVFAFEPITSAWPSRRGKSGHRICTPSAKPRPPGSYRRSIAGHMLELGKDDARLRPFPVLAEGYVADHSVKAVAAHVVGELAVVEALGSFDRLRENLAGRVGKRRERPSQRVDALHLGGFSVFREHLQGAREGE